MKTCVIIDDEQNAIDMLTEFFELHPAFTIINTYNNPLIALKEILLMPQVDLICMDINMPELSGIELSEIIRSKTDKLIIITAHSQYAVEAFEIEANAFLLKPFGFNKFSKILNNLFPDAQLKTGQNQILKDYFFVKNTDEKLILVKIYYRDIVAIESLQNHIQIYTTNGSVTAYLTLKEIKDLLKDKPDYIQVQRSFIISICHIEKLEGNILHMNKALKIKVGSQYKNIFLNTIRDTILKTNR